MRTANATRATRWVRRRVGMTASEPKGDRGAARSMRDSLAGRQVSDAPCMAHMKPKREMDADLADQAD